MGVSRSSVQAAAKVAKEAPDLAAKVKSGELKVSKAAQLARERKRPEPATSGWVPWPTLKHGRSRTSPWENWHPTATGTFS